ncbi:MAG: aldo/keto reductase [Candidatus Thiodiazotropha sp.]
MKSRHIGTNEVSAIGLGCMNLSHAYGTPPAAEAAEALLLRALDLGVNHFDTAALYGFGNNETLVGRVLSPHRNRIYLASKCGMTGVEGKRVIDGRPATIKRTCEQALKRLRTDRIDLYYLHRWDKQVPIEESVGALSRLVEEGKILSIGLSEVSKDTLSRAHAEHPITALQTEYSLWTRNPEIAVLEACRELGVAFVAFSPLARGFLTGAMRDVAHLEEKDIRRQMPRFEAGSFAENLPLLDGFQRLAEQAGATPAQLALAWLLERDDIILPIPGTTSIEHLEENLAATSVRLDSAQMERLDRQINQQNVVGPRYNKSNQSEIDTEEFLSNHYGLRKEQ